VFLCGVRAACGRRAAAACALTRSKHSGQMPCVVRSLRSAAREGSTGTKRSPPTLMRLHHAQRTRRSASSMVPVLPRSRRTAFGFAKNQARLRYSGRSRARSSAGEHSLHTRGVAGSIPAAPTSPRETPFPAGSCRICVVQEGRARGHRQSTEYGSDPSHSPLLVEFRTGAMRDRPRRDFFLGWVPRREANGPVERPGRQQKRSERCAGAHHTARERRLPPTCSRVGVRAGRIGPNSLPLMGRE
jgi:hypothetical protein